MLHPSRYFINDHIVALKAYQKQSKAGKVGIEAAEKSSAQIERVEEVQVGA